MHTEDGSPQDRFPRACTLPTTEQPRRLEEFEALFREALRDVRRLGPTRLVLLLDAAAEGVARELMQREQGCCAFFSFRFGPAEGGRVPLQVVVPQAQMAVVDALAALAAAVGRGRGGGAE